MNGAVFSDRKDSACRSTHVLLPIEQQMLGELRYATNALNAESAQ